MIKRASGFTLMEVMIALGILSVAMMFSSSSVTIIGTNFQTTRRFAKGHDIAGIVSDRGNVLGMMPHPERAVELELGSADGLAFFESILGRVAA